MHFGSLRNLWSSDLTILHRFAQFFYFFISSCIFLYLFFHPQPIIHDAGVYKQIAQTVEKNFFNFPSIDYGNRTFVFPVFLAIILKVSTFLSLNEMWVYSFTILTLLHVTTWLLYKLLQREDQGVSLIFLILSAFNIVNLSFTNVWLTESLAVIFTCISFYFLFSRDKIFGPFFLGLFGMLNVYLRPANLLLMGGIVVLYLFRQKSKKALLFFSFGSIIILLLGVLNTYRVQNKVALFTDHTSHIYLWQLSIAPGYLKYETSVDGSFPMPQMIYKNPGSEKWNDLVCNRKISCIFNSFKVDPIKYSTLLFLHGFNLFDRRYSDTYIADVKNSNPWIAGYTYFVGSSFLLSFLGWRVKMSKMKHFLFISIVMFLFVSLSLYLPTVVEPRFSSHVFPLLLIGSAFHLKRFLEPIPRDQKIRLIVLQILIMIMFIMLSYFVQQTLTINGVFVYG